MSGYSASDALFKKGDGGGPEVFATVAQVTKITPPAYEKNSSDKYVFGQTAPFVLTGRDTPKEMTIELLFDRALADHLAFETDVSAGTERNYQIEFPDNRVWQFGAKITVFTPGDMDAESTDGFTASVTFKLTTDITPTGPA